MLGDNFMKCILKHTNYTSNDQPHDIQENLKKILIPYFLLILFMLTTNLMLIYGFYKTSRPFTIITKLFIYLSLVDIIMMLSRTLYLLQVFLEMSPLMLSIVADLIDFSYSYGIAVFATISFLRYRSIKKPLHSIKPRRIMMVLIGQAISCGLLLGCLFVTLYWEVDVLLIKKLYYCLPILQLLAISFVLCINMMSYRKLKLMKRMVGLSDDIENTSTQRRQKSLSEANICLLYITTFYVLCQVPLSISSLLLLLDLDFWNRIWAKWGFYLLSSILYTVNTGINSLIVVLRTKNLREFYKKKCCFFTRTVGTQNCNSIELRQV